MALQGTIETFALPEVLRLLGTGGKTGRLRVSGDRGSGSVWIDGGKVVGADATGVRDGASTVAVVFELLRFAEGSFSFDDDDLSNADPTTPQDVEVLLHDAERQLGEWQEIEAVVPSLAVGVTFARELPSDDVVIDAKRWKALVAVADGRSVASIADALDLDEFAACRRAKELVEAGLVVVTELVASTHAAEPSDDGQPASGVDSAGVAMDVWSPPDAGSPGSSDSAGYPSDPEPNQAAPGVDTGYTPDGGYVAGSTSTPGTEYAVDGAYAPDAGYATDAGYAPDAGYASDAGYAPDGGYASDAGTPPDAGLTADEAVMAEGGYDTETAYPPVANPPSSARAELDAMASGFGLQDVAPEFAAPGAFSSDDARTEGGFSTAEFSSGGDFSGGDDFGAGNGFDNGFENGFSSDPSADPAFSFAAPGATGDLGLGGFGGSSADGSPYDAPASTASGAALFANDVVTSVPPASGLNGSDGLFAPGTSGFDGQADDSGDAAEVARQLANLSPKAARAVAAAARASTVEEREAALAEVTSEGDEPINRGLLLKFLSSVQT